MRKKILIIFLLLGNICLCSFFIQGNQQPKEKMKAWYTRKFAGLSARLVLLKTAAETDQSQYILQQFFLQARLAYKELEPVLEYYFEADTKRFNGLAIPFVEEEDPTAFQEPQGFQVLETFLYPSFSPDHKKDLLLYIDKLQKITAGLGNNPALFNPQEYMPDAIMEELYRILALGISGFDSPLAKASLPETRAAIGTIVFIAETYKADWQPLEPTAYHTAVRLLAGAVAYLDQHRDFDRFNRMQFITRYLNPLCDAFGTLKIKTGYKENPIHYCLIRKAGSLFRARSLDLNRYGYDEETNADKIALGKQLFFDPVLSANNKRSCAGCHQPGKAFTDGLPKALQLDEHTTLPRNTPTLWNAALQMNMFYDSRHVRLDDVALEVLGNEKEMNNGVSEAIKLPAFLHAYENLFKKAYPNTDAPVTEKNAANAIAVYIKTLVSYNARFDKYMRGEKNQLDAAEISGFNLFMGKAKCGTCHYTPLFNGSKPPAYYYQESEVLGVPANADTLHPLADNDPGRMNILHYDFLNHAFKTPTLRNIALTAPYMHNGVFATLEEVIEFYNRGGGQGLGLDTPNQSLPPDKLNLSSLEKKQLKAFLLTLTDTTGHY